MGCFGLNDFVPWSTYQVNNTVSPNNTFSMTWALNVNNGACTWTWNTNKQCQSFIEQYMLGKSEKPKAMKEATVQKSLKSAVNFFVSLQTSSGCWVGDYGGPLFLLPGLIIVCNVIGVAIGEHYQKEMIKYIFNHQNSNGGWGLYVPILFITK